MISTKDFICFGAPTRGLRFSQRAQPSNENKMSDGGPAATIHAAKVCMANTQNVSRGLLAVRCIAWLDLIGGGN
jgi:hypothetical protein